MNFATVLHMFCFVVYTFSLFYVIIKNPYAVTNWVLAVLFLCFAVWSGSSAVLDHTATSMETARMVMRVQSFGWSSLMAYYFLFILFLTNNKKLLSQPILYVVLLAMPALFMYQNYNGEMLVCCQQTSYGMAGTWKHSFWVLLFAAYYSAIFIWGTYLLYRFMRSTRFESERRIAVIMLGSTVVVFLLGMFFSFVTNLMKFYFPVEASNIFLVFAGALVYCAEKYESFSLSSVRNADKIVELMHEGVVLLDGGGKLTTANHAAFEIFGDPGGKKPGDTIGFIEECLGKTGPGEVTNSQLLFTDLLGARKSVLVSSRRLGGGYGRSGMICTVRDVTDKNKAEVDLVATVKELKRSNEELESFAYLASHDLKEPLRMVSNFVQLLRKKYSDRLDRDGKEYIEFASDGAARMSELIEDLLEYSRVKSRQKEFTDVDTGRIVARVAETLKLKMDEKGASVTAEGALPVVRADGIQVEQLFQNLIGNALKFSGSEPPVIRISAEKKDGFYEFRVRDNGIGIDMQYRDKLFQIFQRLHSREQYDGTGMGLAICRKIAETHGGRIWVESEGEGKGSAFYFTIPA